MFRKRKSHEFEYKNKEGEKFKFKSVPIGYLDAAEFLAEYGPDFLEVYKVLKSNMDMDNKDEEGNTILVIQDILKSFEKGVITNCAKDLFVDTLLLSEDGDWEPLDPQAFESNEEMFTVAKEVFNHNFPDFFGGEEDIEDDSEPTKEEPRMKPAKKLTKKQVDVTL